MEKSHLSGVGFNYIVLNFDTKSSSSIIIPLSTMVNKHTVGFGMSSQRRTMRIFTHEMTQTKQTKNQTNISGRCVSLQHSEGDYLY
jgi:hypothetical protein